MQLLTDWDGFLAEMRNRWPNGATVFLARDGRFTLLTACDSQEGTIFRCKHAIPLEEARNLVQSHGHTCHNGVWSTETEHQSLDELYIAAVAYKSDQKQPGLWVDVYNHYPSPSTVLSKLLEEFNSDGTLDQADNDTFQKIAHPNVVILTPEQIQHFLGKNQSETNFHVIEEPTPEDGTV